MAGYAEIDSVIRRFDSTIWHVENGKIAQRAPSSIEAEAKKIEATRTGVDE